MNTEELNREFIEVRDAAYRYAVSLLQERQEGEDAVQDLYEKLWRRRLLLRKSTFRALVMVSIRNICLDKIRRRIPIVSQMERVPQEAVVEDISGGEVTKIIRGIVGRLPEREREIFHLREVEQMEYSDIASIVGVSESAARMAYSRARNKIKEEYTKIMSYGL